MKFLCIDCDEQMMLGEVRGPDDGSMSVVFGCPSCGKEIAMLTNTMETQLVRSLGVKIGGASGKHEPMRTLRTSLVSDSPAATGAVPSSPEPPPAPSDAAASKCPFTGMVNDALAAASESELEWSESAVVRIERIPSFARAMVIRGVEDYARMNGHSRVTEELLDDVRGRFGM